MRIDLSRSSRALTLLATALILSACGGGGKSTGPEQAGSGALTAKMNGVAWTPSAVTASIGNGVLFVGSADAAGNGFAFGASSQGTGTQTIGPLSLLNANAVRGNQSYLATPNLGTGTVTITLLESNRAVGTFSFNLQGTTPSTTPATLQVTEGKFDVKF